MSHSNPEGDHERATSAITIRLRADLDATGTQQQHLAMVVQTAVIDLAARVPLMAARTALGLEKDATFASVLYSLRLSTCGRIPRERRVDVAMTRTAQQMATTQTLSMVARPWLHHHVLVSVIMGGKRES
jgi:hypothetical protein